MCVTLMAPLFRHWDGLNHIYGVVEVIRDLTKDLKAVLEFEPGLYSHTQVRTLFPRFPRRTVQRTRNF